MYAYEVNRSEVYPDALDAALRTTLGGVISGISTGKGRVSVWFYDQPTPAQESAVLAAVAAHDPAFLSADKTSILNDGQDAATVTIALPQTQAKQVVATIDEVALPAVPVTGGSATLQVTADSSFGADHTLTIGVQDHPCAPLVIGVRDAG